MLTFASVILIGTFTSLPILAETSRFWDLLEIGLGGKEWGKNHAGIRTKTTLILDLVILDFSRTGRMLFDFILNFTF